MIPLERASQEEQNGANFSYVAPSSEELHVHKEIDQNARVIYYNLDMVFGNNTYGAATHPPDEEVQAQDGHHYGNGEDDQHEDDEHNEQGLSGVGGVTGVRGRSVRTLTFLGRYDGGGLLCWVCERGGGDIIGVLIICSL